MNPKVSQAVLLIIPIGLLFTSCMYENKGSRQSSSSSPSPISQPLTQSSTSQLERWSVKRVSDGDTIVIANSLEEQKVRFCGIDTPEKNQPGGAEAKVFVQKAIADSNNKVGFIFVEKDQYERWVGEIFINPGLDNEQFLNALLILEGHAWPYKRYWGNCPNRLALEEAENSANRSGLGLWQKPGAIPPWDWRRRRN